MRWWRLTAAVDQNYLTHAGLSIIPPPSHRFAITAADQICHFYYHQTLRSIRVFTVLMQISDPTCRDDVPMSVKLILCMDVSGFCMKKVILWWETSSFLLQMFDIWRVFD